MAKNEHLKRKLRTEDKLSDSMSWDSMQNGILNKLDSHTAADKKVSFYKWIYATLALALIVAVSILFILNKNTQAHTVANKNIVLSTQSTAQTNTLKTEVHSDTDIINNIDPKNLTNAEIKQATNHTSEITRNTQQTQNNNTGAAGNAYLENNTFTNSSNNHKASINTRFRATTAGTINKDDAQSQQAERLIANQIQSQPSSISMQGIFQNENTYEKIFSVKTDDTKSQLNQIPISQLTEIEDIKLKLINTTTYERSVLSASFAELDNSLQVISISPKPFSIEIAAGANLFTPNFGDSNLGDAKSSYNKLIPGLGAEVLFTYVINPKWQIAAGLNYQSLENKLDYYNEKEVRENKDVVTRIEVNAISGDSTHHTANENVVTTHWQKVVHYNSNKMLSIPVLLNRNWNMHKRFKFVTGVGLQYNLGAISSGKAITGDDGELSSYKIEDYTNGFYSIQSSINFLLSTGVNYELTDRSYLGVDLRGSLGMNDWSTQEEYSAKVMIFDSRFKVGYRF